MIDSTIHQLHELYKESEIPKGFFDVLARRKNSATVTKVDRMLGLLLGEGIAATRADVVRIMRRLADINMGRFVIGRKGQPSRMEWSVRVISMARAAAGQTSEIDMTPPLSSSMEEQIVGEEEVLEHRFHLRPDFVVTVELPMDLTPSEAERLGNFIHTLPIK